MEPARCCHWQPNQLSNDGTKAAERQPFLHRGQHILILVSFAVDHPIRMKPSLRNRRSKQVWTRKAPKDLALRPCGNTCCKQRGRRTIDRACATACELVDSPIGYPTAREVFVYLANAEWQAALPLRNISVQR
jgi:hypothetical protein